MAKIIINRKNEWMNRARGIRVYIDGKKAGSVRNGSSEEFVADAGKHIIECKIDWCASNTYEVELNDTDVKILKLESGMKLMRYAIFLVIAFFLSKLYFQFSHKEMPYWFAVAQIVILAPFLLYLVYYLSIGRKQYLLLSKDDSSIFN